MAKNNQHDHDAASCNVCRNAFKQVGPCEILPDEDVVRPPIGLVDNPPRPSLDGDYKSFKIEERYGTLCAVFRLKGRLDADCHDRLALPQIRDNELALTRDELSRLVYRAKAYNYRAPMTKRAYNALLDAEASPNT